MKYFSTRDTSIKVSAAEAIAQGISNEGGLYLPVEIPKYSQSQLKDLCGMNYNERAKYILKDYLTDYSKEEIAYCVDNAYNKDSFKPKEVAPVVKVTDTSYSLELWHGPTQAFKDMALQILPYLLTTAVEKAHKGKEIVILVATSGDTGKAALEGFKNVEGTNILVFYPDGGVSPVQFLQMATQEGDNVGVYAVTGNFDDTQTKVKEIFTNESLSKELADKNLMFSSANSINWGRLLPQIVYYISAYCDLVNAGEIALGDKINVTVPTGNFGNILAAYYGKQMGLPINKLICASNINNVLTDFINTGHYDRKREFMLTSSPSMDILISSNLERLLYLLYQDSAKIEDLMEQLSKDGEYQVSPQIHDILKENFYGGFASEEETAKTINEYFTKYDYPMDPHTAVAFKVYDDYLKETGDITKTIVASTANPYKFSGSMLKALQPEKPDNNEFSGVYQLNSIIGTPIPEEIKALECKEKRFTQVIAPNEMEEVVRKKLKI